MIPNVGRTDQMVRYVLAVVFFGLAFFFSAGVWAWLLGLLGVVMVVTAAFSFCPLWAVLRINTRGKAAS